MPAAHIRPILWAQWRVWRSYNIGGGTGGRILGLALTLLWYGVWVTIAAAAALALSAAPRETLERVLPWAFLGVAAYWQLTPILAASMGASLDLRKLLVYPIPESRLFAIEVMLRLTTGLEALLVLCGITAGLAWNAEAPPAAPFLAAAVFVLFNLFLAAGVRNLFERLMAYRRVREILVLAVVLVAALPQLLAYTGLPPALRRAFSAGPSGIWPWTAAGRFACGAGGALDFALLALWTAGALAFGRRQFHSSLSFDRAAVEATSRPQAPGARWRDALYRAPALIFRDPIGAMIEKELRSLVRTPRFRLVFLMGFSFGMIIWLPLLREGGWREAGNYPVLVGGYAMVLLAEVAFWNAFGFDRSAAQVYFCAPVPFWKVLAAKNLAALTCVMIELTIILAACRAIGFPLTPWKVLESYAVIATLCLYMLAAGNLSSIHYPRAVSPEHTWARSSGGRFQLILLLLFPVLAAPVLLAYAARYAFASDPAFWAVLAFAAAAGAAAYGVSLDSAVSAATQKREALVAALSQGGGPVSTN